MAMISSTQVGEFKLSEAFAIGLTKTVLEQGLTPVVGNGNYTSGASKLVLAWAIPKYVLKGNMGKTVGTALAVDGTEDIIRATMGTLNLNLGGASSSSSLI